jgi:DNA-binding NarL/FixJ family response regulator
MGALNERAQRVVDVAQGHDMTSFLIIDDHPLFREALGDAVRSALADAVIFEAMSIDEALHVLASEPGIELGLLDLSLPDATGFSGFLRLRENLSEASGRDPIQRGRSACRARSAVARGCRLLAESTSKRELTLSIERVLSRSISVPRNFVPSTGRGNATSVQALESRVRELTPQQLRVLDLIRRGYQNKQIAFELQLAESTVKAHVTEILRKLKLFSRNKAVIEISKIDLPVPKGRPGLKADRSKLQ